MTTETSVAVAVKRPRAQWDLVVSPILMVLAVLIGCASVFSAFFLVFATDSCGVSTCDSGQFALGWSLALFVPPVVLLAGIITGIVLLVRRRIAVWAPGIAIVLAVLVWWAGVAIVFASVNVSAS